MTEESRKNQKLNSKKMDKLEAQFDAFDKNVKELT